MDILVPHGFRAGKGDFYRILQDLHTNDEQGRQILNGIICHLRDSFVEDARRQGKRLDELTITESEKKRRVSIMAKWYCRLRGDFHCSALKCLDHLGKALRAELDGTVFIPPVQRKLWAPN